MDAKANVIKNNFIQYSGISSAIDQELHRKTKGTWRSMFAELFDNTSLYKNSIGQSQVCTEF